MRLFLGSDTGVAAKRLGRTILIAVLGLVFARVAGIVDVTESGLYMYGVTTLLAIGLYASASGIPREAVRDLRTVLIAVSLGVLLKAALIAGVMYLVFREPSALILGIVVAQIDPLSVAAMRNSSRMSPRAKAVLLAWASFDDPITALLVVYLSAPVLRWSGGGGPAIGAPVDADLGSYLFNLGANLAFAGICLGLWTAVRRWRPIRPEGSPVATTGAVLLLAALIAVAVANFLMLGIALLGLFYRPQAARLVDGTTAVAFTLATFALGMLLVGVDMLRGVALGMAAFGAQVVIGRVIARRMARPDRGYLALGQQNGITAIVLALTLEPSFPGTVAVVAPAILTVNVIHIVANELWARHLADGPEPEPDDDVLPLERPEDPPAIAMAGAPAAPAATSLTARPFLAGPLVAYALARRPFTARRPPVPPS